MLAVVFVLPALLRLFDESIMRYDWRKKPVFVKQDDLAYEVQFADFESDGEDEDGWEYYYALDDEVEDPDYEYEDIDEPEEPDDSPVEEVKPDQSVFEEEKK